MADAYEENLAANQQYAQRKSEILRLFSDDPTAEVMVEGIIDGMDGEELRSLTELDKTGFATKRRLIRRRIEKAYPQGREP